MTSVSGPPRILITGSRDWDDEARIRFELEFAYKGLRPTDWPRGTIFPVVLVSGACPTGADRIAETIWEAQGLPVERHPADWDQFGKRAGFLRNQKMVDLGAVMCLAFIKNNSRGATHTADAAQRGGIPTTRFIDGVGL